MDKILRQFRASKDDIDRRLRACMENKDPMLAKLYASVNYSLQSGGKRVRPTFCFLVGELFGVEQNRLASLACAVEMIHTASLIMDDLPQMDNGKLRRGKPANHNIYGQDVAALASVGLLMRSCELIAEDKMLSDAHKAKLVGILTNNVGLGGMVAGQFVDLEFSNPNVDYRTLEYIHHHKTALLFIASGKCAAIIGGANKDERVAVEAYAKYIGFAFQIADDLMDVIGSAETSGKDGQKDCGNFVKLIGISRSKALIGQCVQKAGSAVKIFGEMSDKLLAFRDFLLNTHL